MNLQRFSKPLLLATTLFAFVQLHAEYLNYVEVQPDTGKNTVKETPSVKPLTKAEEFGIYCDSLEFYDENINQTNFAAAFSCAIAADSLLKLDIIYRNESFGRKPSGNHFDRDYFVSSLNVLFQHAGEYPVDRKTLELAAESMCSYSDTDYVPLVKILRKMGKIDTTIRTENIGSYSYKGYSQYYLAFGKYTIPHGKQEKIYSDGLSYEKTNYKHGTLHGMQTINIDGSKLYTCNYNQGYPSNCIAKLGSVGYISIKGNKINGKVSVDGLSADSLIGFNYLYSEPAKGFTYKSFYRDAVDIDKFLGKSSSVCEQFAFSDSRGWCLLGTDDMSGDDSYDATQPLKKVELFPDDTLKPNFKAIGKVAYITKSGKFVFSESYNAQGKRNGIAKYGGMGTVTFLNGVLSGTATEYYRKSGKVKLKTTFLNGLQNGVETYFYENGKIKSTGSAKNGKRIGAWKSYSMAGTVESSGTYVNGLKEGLWKETTNGRLQSISYSKGKPAI